MSPPSPVSWVVFVLSIASERPSSSVFSIVSASISISSSPQFPLPSESKLAAAAAALFYPSF